MPNDATVDFLDLLRRASRRDRLAPLVDALGFSPAHERIPRSRWADHGLNGESSGTLHRMGRREGSEVWALISANGMDVHDAGRVIRALQASDVSRHALLIAADREFRRLALLVADAGGGVRSLVVRRSEVRASDADTLRDMVARPEDGAIALGLRHVRALDRSRVTRRFFEDFRERRNVIASAWSGLPARNLADREQLALLFLCRLMFLYFLQREGHLAGDERFLPHLIERWQTRPRARSFYRAVVIPLFFGVLNRRPEQRSAPARALGPLPYLNGGLFERHALERRHATLDLPDAVVRDTFDDLLERYRFTAREAPDTDGGGIDPEMLGRVFEGVMAAPRRGDTGTFYTPSDAVDGLVRESLATWLSPLVGHEAAGALMLRDRAAVELDAGNRAACRKAARALEDVRVLDPACGSGAFLLGALRRITSVRVLGTDRSAAEVGRDVVGRALHGVDVQGDAALLCALRLWLALTHDDDGTVRPLPNLDRRIRQGDALLDPIDLAGGGDGDHHAVAMDADVRTNIRSLAPLAGRYLRAGPERRDELRAQLEDLERATARAWIGALRRRAQRRILELQAIAEGRDLFGGPGPGSIEAARALITARGVCDELDALRKRLRDDRAVPFFSFAVHFAEAASRGFDLVLSNPPWVRAHRWPAAVRGLMQRRYESARQAGWRDGARLAGAPVAAAAQADLSLLFLERSLSLLAPGGVAGLLLPAKMIRSLYAGAARRWLLERAPILSLRDCSLDQHAVFRADAFAASVVARRLADDADQPSPAVKVALVRRHAPALQFELPRNDLPLFPDQPDAPWLLAPPAARDAMRRMQRAGPPIGHHPSLRVRRGVFTGANPVLVVPHATPRLGGLASMRALGFTHEPHAGTTASDFEAVIEAAMLRPLLRGAGIDAWSWSAPDLVLWLHGDDGRPIRPPARTARYLARHAAALAARSGATRGFPPGALFRVTPDTVRHRVAWHDLSDTLKAVALPDRVRSTLGEEGPLVALNTVYFIPTGAAEEALLLTAYFNSTPIRTFARAVAERAKDARFRFFAWTVAALPLPGNWASSRQAPALLRLARDAHHDGGMSESDTARLDDLVASHYRLRDADRTGLLAFDRWLRGMA